MNKFLNSNKQFFLQYFLLLPNRCVVNIKKKSTHVKTLHILVKLKTDIITKSFYSKLRHAIQFKLSAPYTHVDVLTQFSSQVKVNAQTI